MRSPKDTGRGGRAGRVLATATASCVLAAGFLAAPVAGLPWNTAGLQTLAADQHTPDLGAGSRVGEGVSVGVVGTSTSTGPTTVREVLGVLERAELVAQDAGRKVTPEAEQAAAELGMLLSTYLAQQAATASDRPFAAVDFDVPAPVAPAPDEAIPDQTTPDDVPAVVPVSRDVAIGPADDPATERPDDVRLPDAAEPDAAQPEAAQPEAEGGHEGDPVTFDDVVVAATRLATLLDPATTTLEAGILPAGADGTVAARATLTAGLLEVVDRYGRSTAGFANGRIPTSALCPLDFAPGHMLRCDAAQQLSALSKEYEKAFGVPIPMTDSYRTLESQIRLKATKGWLAATPGTSNHGWGLAVDLGLPISTGTSAEYTWMRVHAPDYGWDNPSWAWLTGSKPEPWHFEFFAAGPIPDRAWSADDVASDGGSSTVGSERSDKEDKGDKAKGGADEGPAKKAGATSGTDQSPGTKGSGKDTGDEPGRTAQAKVTVPDVAGQSVAAATKKLEGLGLEVSTQKQADAKAAAGTVLSTEGAGTKVKKGSTVTLVVSSGPAEQAKVTVPDVAGQSVAAATKKLEGLGLEVSTQKQADAKAAAGTVLSTEGAGTKVKKGSTVTLVVSSGPEQVTVPDVTGWTVGDARAELEARGFAVVMDPADGVQDGDLVVRTEGAGTAVPKGSTVVLSWGAAEPVPDVAGWTVADATAELEAHGFEVSTDPAEGVEDEDVVVETTETGTVLKGSTITLVVSRESASKDPDA
ncbi:PASTA domain-containing protein [Krasilnikoviella flava]|uniref:PASTA domain, binds beta-lactams n=1 Tax=Krasilnikoviella flava TaxID=526729 RepID=A0A1T5M0A4_9MICO|nr:PASTA domain-containing protein [Krasilnikoviella flava]SKC81656.1 PASTA domain, binds beta-lactams [Krasilnikoviella flava]